MTGQHKPSDLSPLDTFPRRHIGPSDSDSQEMLGHLGFTSLDDLIQGVVPSQIQTQHPLNLPSNQSEQEILSQLRNFANQNTLFRSYIGTGYYDCLTPTVILRNILENPAWYTQYTPYQAEIAQGRLEALLNFQTLVADLTGLPLSNASLLDEATAAAEAMSMCWAIKGENAQAFFVAEDCHPQTIAVMQTRANPLGIHIEVGPTDQIPHSKHKFCGMLLQ